MGDEMSYLETASYIVGASVLICAAIVVVAVALMLAAAAITYSSSTFFKSAADFWWSVAWLAWKKKKGKVAKHALRIAIEKDEGEVTK